MMFNFLDSWKSEYWLPVGRVKGGQGLKGNLFVSVFEKKPSWTDRWTSLNLVKDEQAFEFPISNWTFHKDGIVVTTALIQNRNQSDFYKGSIVYIPRNFLKSTSGEHIYLNEVINFLVKDIKLGAIGYVHGFSSNGPQDLLIVKEDESEISFEIPFIKEFLCNIDYESKIILMDLPEGLMQSQK